MRYTDLAEEINAKITEQCQLVAKEMVLKTRVMEPIPPLGYCRPELYKPRKLSRYFSHISEEVREQIRSLFGLPGKGVAE